MRTVVAGIREREGRVLIGERARPAWAAGQWEFLGSEVEPDETVAAALTRKCCEELGTEGKVQGEVYRHELSTALGVFTLVALRVRVRSDQPRPLEHRALAWVTPADLPHLRLLASNVPIAEALNAVPQSPLHPFTFWGASTP
ncbi:MAG: NUDIX domain-containing protein, partial [Deinococcota bacterium]